MEKSKALKLLGGTAADAAEAIGVTVQSVHQWPDPLPRRIADRVYAVLYRRDQRKKLAGRRGPKKAP